MLSQHAELRMKQRGISPEIIDLLISIGDVRAAPGGALIRFFSKRSKRLIRAEYGDRFVAKNHEKFTSYLIESTNQDEIITVGKLYKKPRNKI
jgi:hypothetical protein